ncbi:hypothetical protein V8B55DRAFT_1542607 [Mucor lusitanicus]|uniref:Post-SET domain-containing protein n=2 Tax=Mucor circinelloides f. lusitanicus TaxID=29924 RepID=A0A162QWN1_MUCCL|nr:hypothetical protein FB192DRAFT_1389064 [Mucor lusitanicus]OAD06300.1 hypothetical protein MUCCIDRAFT_106871 [Mucor lusitanicus CBS 277.49]
MQQQEQQAPSHPGLFKVLRQGDSTSFSSKLVAERDFKKGETIADLTGLTPGPKRYSSVQISATEHVELNSDLLYLNHSCDPSTYLDITKRAIVALKDIKQGEELTFFYPSTEWDMAQVFDCWCGADKCVGKVNGARHTPTEVLEQFTLSEHIIQLIKERDSNQ